MTVVDTTSGEIIEIADREEAERLAVEVSSAIAHMNARTGAAIEIMVDAFKARIWIALGFGSWPDLVEAKGWRFKPLTSDDRAAYGELFRTNGMSFRAIATIVSADKRTVQRDLAGGAFAPPDEVVGADGKTYQPTRPTPPPVDEVEDDEEDGEPIETLDEPMPVEGDEPATPPVIDLELLRDPIEDAQVELARELAGSHRLQRRFPAERVTEIADQELLGMITEHGKRTAEWVAQIAADSHGGLRAIPGGRS